MIADGVSEDRDSARSGENGVEWLLRRLREWGDRTALIWQGEAWSYHRLCDHAETCLGEFRREDVQPGTALAICGDYSPAACALLIAAIGNRNIVVPLTTAAAERRDRRLQIAEVQAIAELQDDDKTVFHKSGRALGHELLKRLAGSHAPGLVLFSSGSSGESKGAVLDFGALLGRFRKPRPGFVTLAFLLLDHIGGLNTLFHTLCHGGTVVTAPDRTPDTVAATIAAHRVQLLPTTPTFLRMLLISEAHTRHDLGSLEIITYGTEPMPPATLTAVRKALPRVRLKQTYGLSELGILPTQSLSSDSLWLKLGADGFEHRTIDSVLHIRAASAMLGYLNAPAPFDADGWFNTNDLVATDGEYLRILGRRTELINVGGEKVHPTEIENILLQVENVKDATVSARPSPVTGAVVAARITPCRPEQADELKRRVRRFCHERLERYKVPAVIQIIEQDQHGSRFKKSRAVLED
jgi:long-chain acyl-CoA synthetase